MTWLLIRSTDNNINDFINDFLQPTNQSLSAGKRHIQYVSLYETLN
ncbi:MAG: hypothetical protein O3A14_17935 [Cyanobacteria bacterium]|nr:hypothetical protein [Cyanobacteriota bacterium]